MRLSRAITVVTLALSAPAAQALKAQTRSNSSAAARGSIFTVTFRADTTLRETPFDTSALDTAAARRLAGCYTVHIGAWSDPHGYGGGIRTPAEIHLDTITAARSPRAFVVETPGFVNPSRFAVPPHWAPVRQDSLQATVTASQTDLVTIFARRHADGTFTAIARYFTDAIAVDPLTKRWLWETYPTAPVKLTAHACASASHVLEPGPRTLTREIRL